MWFNGAVISKSDKNWIKRVLVLAVLVAVVLRYGNTGKIFGSSNPAVALIPLLLLFSIAWGDIWSPWANKEDKGEWIPMWLVFVLAAALVVLVYSF